MIHNFATPWTWRYIILSQQYIPNSVNPGYRALVWHHNKLCGTIMLWQLCKLITLHKNTVISYFMKWLTPYPILHFIRARCIQHAKIILRQKCSMIMILWKKFNWEIEWSVFVDPFLPTKFTYTFPWISAIFLRLKTGIASMKSSTDHIHTHIHPKFSWISGVYNILSFTN